MADNVKIPDSQYLLMVFMIFVVSLLYLCFLIQKWITILYINSRLTQIIRNYEQISANFHSGHDSNAI